MGCNILHETMCLQEHVEHVRNCRQSLVTNHMVHTLCWYHLNKTKDASINGSTSIYNSLKTSIKAQTTSALLSPFSIIMSMASSSEKSKILVIGATGYMGKFIVEASANLGHCTFALVRESVLDDPTKLQTLEHLKSCLLYTSPSPRD